VNVRLEIDRLIIEGFDGLDVPFASRGALAAAVERELAALIAAGGLAPWTRGGGTVPSVTAPEMAVSSPQTLTRPAAHGATVAGAIYRGIGSPGLPGAGTKR
jgi:hypothetical protein